MSWTTRCTTSATLHLVLMRKKHWQAQILEHALGRPTQNEIAHPRMAVTTHHQQLGALFDRVFLKADAGWAILGADGDPFGRKTAFLSCWLRAAYHAQISKLGKCIAQRSCKVPRRLIFQSPYIIYLINDLDFSTRIIITGGTYSQHTNRTTIRHI